jgi:type II secretion system protein I
MSNTDSPLKNTVQPEFSNETRVIQRAADTPRPGFTLMEVIVALGIAATALILLLSSNNESLRRGINARQRETVEWLAESKLNELACGAETSRQGSFAGQPGLAWEASVEPAAVPDVKGLQRLTLKVFNKDSSQQPLKSISVFIYQPADAASVSSFRDDPTLLTATHAR